MPKSGKPEQTIESYIAGLPPDAALIMERVRETMRSVAPKVRESIKYEIALFEYGGTYLYIGAWKKHLGMYPIYPLPSALEAEIAPHRAKKDTVQFFYRNPIPYELIARMTKARVKSPKP